MPKLELGKYEITSKTTPINQNGEAKHFGDVIELSISQAQALKSAIKPVDEVAQNHITFLSSALDTKVDVTKMRDHEKQGMLEQRRSQLEKELEQINSQFEALKAKQQPAPQPARSPATQKDAAPPQPPPEKAAPTPPPAASPAEG